MKIVIITHFEENYGAHDWNGEGACPQHWKAKGGNTYIFENVSLADAQDQNYWFGCSSMVTHSDEYSKEYVVDMELVDDIDFNEDDYVAWYEAPWYCDVEKDTKTRTREYPAGFRNEVAKIVEVRCLSDGTTIDIVYTMDDGTETDYKGCNAYCRKADEYRKEKEAEIRAELYGV